jgi:hypothetical protein
MIPLLTKKQAAAILAVTPRTLDRMRASGYDLGAIKLPGGAVRFDPTRIREIIETRRFGRRLRSDLATVPTVLES